MPGVVPFPVPGFVFPFLFCLEQFSSVRCTALYSLNFCIAPRVPLLLLMLVLLHRHRPRRAFRGKGGRHRPFHDFFITATEWK